MFQLFWVLKRKGVEKDVLLFKFFTRYHLIDIDGKGIHLTTILFRSEGQIVLSLNMSIRFTLRMVGLLNPFIYQQGFLPYLI